MFNVSLFDDVLLVNLLLASRIENLFLEERM
jgi:hypothetical protein